MFSIVLLDDNFVVRQLVKIFVAALAKWYKVTLKIFTANNGVEGLGFIYVTDPNIIIVDTTLPKYSGREVLSYLVTNPKFSEKGVKVIILDEGGTDVDLDLPDTFQIIRKDSPQALTQIILAIRAVLHPMSANKPMKVGLLTRVANRALYWGNYSDQMQRALSKKGAFLKRILNRGNWFVSEFVTSLLLTTVIFFSSISTDENIQQERMDYSKMRVKYYPTLVVGIVAFLLVGANVGLFALSQFGLFRSQVTDVSAATVTVTNTNDAGPGSLRWAIINYNLGPSIQGNLINFSISGSGPHVISLASPLPDIVVDKVWIDATTQSGTDCTNSRPQVAIDGSSVSGNGLTFANSDDSSVKGLAIYGFSGTGIDATSGTSDNLTIQCNIIGLEANGSTVNGNGNGIILNGSGHLVGGTSVSNRNIISGNDFDGVRPNGTNIDLYLNAIGVGSNLTSDKGNGGVGVKISGNNVNVGGTSAIGNIIAYNGGGVSILYPETISTDYSILRNSIYNNGGSGISTAFGTIAVFRPTITDITGTTISFTMADMSGTYLVQFFESPDADSSGFGEGKTFMSCPTNISNPNSSSTYTVNCSEIDVGDVVTGRVIRNYGGGDYGPTSTFSNAYTVAAVTPTDTPTPTPTPCPAVGSTTITSVDRYDAGSSDSIDFEWTAASNADNYNLEMSTNGGSSWGTVGAYPGTSLTGTGFDKNTTYRFRLRPWNSCGNFGPYSNETADLPPLGVNAVLDLTPDPPDHGDFLDLEVRDNDSAANTNSGSRQNITVSVENRDTGETENHTLQETGNDTGIFQKNNAIELFYDTGTNGNSGEMNVQDNDDIRMTYNDPALDGGGSGNRTTTITVNITGQTASLDLQPDPPTVGDFLDLEVTDNDIYANNDSGSAESITVSVENRDTGETENHTLNETGNNTGVFQKNNAIQLFYGGSPNGTDGRMNILDNHDIRMTYADPLFNDGSSGNRTRTITAEINGVTANAIIGPASPDIGDQLDLEVRDNDPFANTDSGSRQNITVDVVNQRTGESETHTLQETGNNTGVFQKNNAIELFYGSSQNGNNDEMNIEDGDRIELVYEDPFTATGATNSDQTDEVTTNITGVSASLTLDPDPPTVGDFLDIEVSDNDVYANGDSGSRENITVEIENRDTGETEDFTLQETGNNTGIFQLNNALELEYGTSAGSNNNGRMNIKDNDDIRLTYSDPLLNDGSSGNRTRTITAEINGVTASTTLSPNSPDLGDQLDLEVNDNDPFANTDSGNQETVSVEVENLRTGETENHNLQETGNNTGLFQDNNAVELFYGASQNGTNGDMNVLDGDEIEIRYIDPFTATGSTNVTRTDSVIVNITGQNASLDLQPDPPTVSDLLDLEVTDNDVYANTDSGSQQNITVSVENQDTGETENHTLVETGNNTGVFRKDNAIELLLGGSVNGDNGRMNILDNHDIRMIYADPLLDDGSSGNRTTTITTNVTNVDASTTVLPNNPDIGDQLDLEVNDNDQFANTDSGNRENVTVTVENLRSNETESHTLQETGDNTGLFQVNNAIELFYGSGPNSTDGDMDVLDGDVIEIRYTDPFDAAGSANVLKTDSVTVNITGQSATFNLTPSSPNAPDTLNIEVTNNDVYDNDPGAVDTIDVDVTNLDIAGGDGVSGVTLTETGNNTGVFTGSIIIVYGTTGQTGNSTITAEDGDRIEVLYDDPLLGNGGTGDRTSEVSVDVLGTNANLIIDDPITISTPINLRVEDNDVYTNDPSSVDTITVDISNIDITNGDTETGIVLTETGNDTGIFTGTVSTIYGTTGDGGGDGSITGAGGDRVDFTYNDPLIDDGSSDIYTAQGNVIGGVNATIDIDPDPAQTRMTLQLDVDDNDGGTNTNQSGVDEVTVIVTNDMTGEIETVQLEETGDNTGLFVDKSGDTIDLFYATTAGDNNDNNLGVKDGDTLTLSYTDPLDITGNPLSLNKQITIINNGVTAADDSESVDKNTPVDIDVFSNDTDVDGDVVLSDNASLVVLSGPTNGTTDDNLGTGEIRYTPDNNFSGIDSFTYNLCDEQAVCNSATVTVTVINNPISAAIDFDSFSKNVEGGTDSYTMDLVSNDTDIDNDRDTSYLVITANPGGGTISNIDPVTGEVDYQPNENYAGLDSFTYEICDVDTNVTCDTATVGVDVTNSAIVLVDDSGSSPKAVSANDQTVVIDVDANDSDADGVIDIDTSAGSFEIVSAPSNGIVSISSRTNGEISYSPDAQFAGNDSFDYQLCDKTIPTPSCDTASVDITVSNSTLTFDDDSFSNAKRTSLNSEELVIDVSGLVSDPDGAGDIDYSSLSVVGGMEPANGTITSISSSQVTYEPTQYFAGDDTFELRICDATGITPSCDTATFNVTITNNPIVPVIDLASNTKTTNTSLSQIVIDLTANDTDADGVDDIDPSTATIVTGQEPTNGTVADLTNGVLTYQPDTYFAGDDSFTYRICDRTIPTPSCVNQTITLTTTNEVPVLVQDQDSLGKTTDSATSTIQLDILDNDSDPDGTDDIDFTSFSIVTQPSNGTAQVIDQNNGTIEFEPDLHFAGTDTLTYELCDKTIPTPACTTQTVEFEVTNQLPVPVAESDTVSKNVSGGTHSTNTNVVQNDTDPDGVDDIDVGSITITAHPANGRIVSINSGEVTYEPDEYFAGTDTYTYEVCDKTVPVAGCTTEVVTITVTNSDITLQPDTGATRKSTDSLDNDVTLSLVQNDSDPDGTDDIDLDTLTTVVDPENGETTVDNTTGEITYTPTKHFAGIDTFRYEVCDKTYPVASCAQEDVSVTVTNSDVVLVADTGTVPKNTVEGDEGIVIAVSSNDSDPDGNDDLNFDSLVITTEPEFGEITQIDALTGSLTYTPTTNFAGDDSFVYELCDKTFPVPSCDSAQVSITVENGELQGNTDVLSTGKNTSEEVSVNIVNVVSNDLDADGEEDLDLDTLALVDQPQFGSAQVSETIPGAIEYIPVPNFAGEDTVSYQVCDQTFPVPSCDIATVTFYIDNSPIQAVDQSELVGKNREQAVVLNSSVTDQDGGEDIDLDTLRIVEQPANGVVEILVNGQVRGISTREGRVLGTVKTVSQPAQIVYTPNNGFAGEDEVSYEVCDFTFPERSCDTATILFEVLNTPVKVSEGTLFTDKTIPVDLQVLQDDTDVDGDIDFDSLKILNDPENGTITLDKVNGIITYTPNLGFAGSDSFVYEICDDSNSCDSAIVNVTVVNSPYKAVDDAISTPVGRKVAIDVVKNDQELDGVKDIDFSTLQVVNDAGNGKLTKAKKDGVFNYTPNTDFEGVDSFVYELCDLSESCSSASVVINVNDRPINANDDSAVTLPDTEIEIDILQNDITVEGSIDISTLVFSQTPANGVVTATENGTVLYTPNPEYKGDDLFVYKVCNTVGDCDSAQVRIVVTEDPTEVVEIEIQEELDQTIVPTPTSAGNQAEPAEEEKTIVENVLEASPKIVTVAAPTAVLIYNYPGMVLFLLGRLKRKKDSPWGIVYDKEKKQPVAFARISILKDGVVYKSEATDLEGRYGFALPKGQYVIEVVHNNFVKFNKSVSVLSNNQSLVEDIALVSEVSVSEAVDKSEQLKKVIKDNLNKILVGFFFAGLAYTLYSAVTSGGVFNYVLLGLYLIQVAIVLIFWLLKKPKNGYVYEQGSRDRVQGAFVRVFDKDRQLNAVLTDEQGRYNLILDPGTYYISVDAKGYDFATAKNLNLVDLGSGEKFIEFKNKKVAPLNLYIALKRVYTKDDEPTISSPF